MKPFFPTTEGLNITTPYGWRTHPVSGEPDFHAAIDIGGGGVNHPIYATQSGEVIQVGYNDGSGNFLRIKHMAEGDVYYSQYLHLAYVPMVTKRQLVNRGQQIGVMGTTGISTGIHLDFAIAINSTGWFTEAGTIDPLLYLQMEFGEGEVIGGDKHSNLIHLYLSGALIDWYK